MNITEHKCTYRIFSCIMHIFLPRFSSPKCGGTLYMNNIIYMLECRSACVRLDHACLSCQHYLKLAALNLVIVKWKIPLIWVSPFFHQLFVHIIDLQRCSVVAFCWCICLSSLVCCFTVAHYHYCVWRNKLYIHNKWKNILLTL